VGLDVIVLGSDLRYTFWFVNLKHGAIYYQANAPINFVENRMKRLLLPIALLTISSLVFVACSEDDPEPTATSVPSAPAATGGRFDDTAVMLSPGDEARAPLGALDTSKTYHATFKTDAGEFKILLFDDEAPLTVENFINLTTLGFYDGLMFHRVIPEFMAQGGDPTGTGSGGPGYQFRDEFDGTRRHDKPGVLSMANAGPNTNGSQFFITFVPTPHLDGRHTIFGEVVEDLENVLNLEVRDPGTAQLPGDLIKSITITES
jgi:cyclophilin family peptidyl-prolyl cis-trans isomerase